jgi:hypothetical protein
MKKSLHLLLSTLFLLLPLAAMAAVNQPEMKTIADLPPAAQMAATEAFGRDDAAYHGLKSGKGFRMKSVDALAADFTDSGATVEGWRLSLAAVGRGADLRPAAPVKPEQKANRVEYRRGDVTEWFINGPLGLEHGFTLGKRPGPAGVEPLTLALCTSDKLKMQIADGGRDVTLQGDGENPTLGYGKLAAWDATGKTLAAWFEIAGNREASVLHIRVNDSTAQYPITVDPMVQRQKLTASDAATNDYFGSSVWLSSDGNTVLIGTPGKSSFRGAAYLFTRSGSTWTEQQKLTASDAATLDRFGSSVSLSSDANTALIGAIGKSSSTGAAYLFTRSGSGWSEQQKLLASDAATNDYFGSSVSLSSDGNTALIGAYAKSSNTGTAYLFTRSGSAWTEQQKLTASDAAAGDAFGLSVSLSSDGNTALIGTPGKNTDSGAAYLFTRSGSAWTEQQKLTASDTNFGFSVSLSSDGNTALIGAIGKSTLAGAAYLFTRSGSAWTEQQRLTASDAAINDNFGNSVYLSSDGNTVLIGANTKSSNTGTAYLFTRSGSAWTEQQKLLASDAATFDQFGSSVALSSDGNTALIGAKQKNSYTGAAYLFRLACSEGQYDNGISCTPCAAGTYQPSTGQASCLSCAPGLYQYLTGQNACLSCPVNTYQPLTGQISLNACSVYCIAGEYYNGTVCTQCAIGTYQTAGFHLSCEPAPAGTFVGSPGATAPTACSPGEYQSLTGQFSCIQCLIGKYQPSTGQSACLDAPAGFMAPSPGTATLPTPCPAGTFQANPGASSCTACPAGTVQPATGQTACVAIPKAAGSIVIDQSTTPATLFAAIDTEGVYKSPDDGASWAAANGTTPNNITNLRVKVLARNATSGALYAATYGSGIFKSIDSATNWNACATQPGNQNVVALTIDAGGKLYAGTEGGVFVSNDGCGTWAAMNGGLPN